MLEPGLDRHEWESRWAVLEEELADEPAGANGYRSLYEYLLAERSAP